jgi:hypothetical protein
VPIVKCEESECRNAYHAECLIHKRVGNALFCLLTNKIKIYCSEHIIQRSKDKHLQSITFETLEQCTTKVILSSCKEKHNFDEVYERLSIRSDNKRKPSTDEQELSVTFEGGRNMKLLRANEGLDPSFTKPRPAY